MTYDDVHDIVIGTRGTGAMFVVVDDRRGRAFIGWAVWRHEDRAQGVAESWPDALLAVEHFLSDRFRTEAMRELALLLRAEGLGSFY